MATLGEFSSLLQLGFGIGIGLSYFRAPVELRSASLRQAIEDEITIVRGVSSAKAQQKLGDLSSLKLAFNEEIDKLEGWQLPFMIAALAGGAGNWIALVFASVSAQCVLTATGEFGLIFLSVGYYILLAIALEFIAQWRFRSVRLRLVQIRST
jgi:hypothetical protein